MIPTCFSCRAFNVPFYIGVIAPFLFIYLFNWIIYGIIIISFLRKAVKPLHVKEVKEERKRWKQQLLIAITLSLLFGLGWGIGLPATQSLYADLVRNTFSILFIFLSTFQGAFVFIM